MNAELHLPDLPEVPVSVGAAGAHASPARSWGERVRALLGTFLPLLLMVALALVTWWLVKVAPSTPSAGGVRALTHDPDYTLDHFTMQRYGADGQLAVRIEGRTLRHFPDTDELAIDTVRIDVTSPDGRVTRATAAQAVAAGDGSQARLEGNAEVVSQGPGGEPPMDLQAQRLVFLIRERKVTTDQPVHVTQGRTEFTADALDYDDRARLLVLHGKVRARLTPLPARR